MKLNVQLYPGVYTIGIARPWYASRSTVRSKLKAMTGLDEIVFHKRSSALPSVSPRLDPYYSDEWDEWIEARYTSEPRTIETEKIWAWMIVTPASGGQAPPPPPAPVPQEPTSSSPADTIVGPAVAGFVVLGFALLLVRKR